MTLQHPIKFLSFNCKGFKPRNYNYLRKIFQNVDFMLVQELWLYDHEFDVITKELSNCNYFAKSSMNSCEFRNGRPYGGLAIIWKSNSYFSVDVIDTMSDRLLVCKIESNDFKFLLFNVYMPTNSLSNNVEFEEILHEIISVSLMYDSYNIIVAGDFNCDVKCADDRTGLFNEFVDAIDLFSPTADDSCSVKYTFINSQNQTSFIDHFCVSECIKNKVKNISSLDEGDNLSDHNPIILQIVFESTLPNNFDCVSKKHKKFKICWDSASKHQIDLYKNILSDMLNNLPININIFYCNNFNCINHDHLYEFNLFLSSLLESIEIATFASIDIKYKNSDNQKSKIMIGWNKYVEQYRKKSIFWHNIWKECGRPNDGHVAIIRRKTRQEYHKSVVNLKSNNDIMLKDKIAILLHDNEPKNFWREINKITNKRININTIDGVTGVDVCSIFQRKYEELYNEAPIQDLKIFINKINSDINESCCGHGNSTNHLHSVSSIMVKDAIKKLNKGKGDVSDIFSTDSFINAPDNLCDYLALLFTSMLTHGFSCSYFNLIHFSPIIKNKRKSFNDSNNYRAIAINSSLCKIFDYVLLQYFKDIFSTNSRQFAYKPESSTTTCTFVLLETIDYYIKHGSSVIVSLLDCSKAFDRVNYNKLFKIISNKGMCPLVSRILAIMYSNIEAQVKWNGYFSDKFKINNGVKQGGVISPVLFNLYTDSLIERITKSHVGCHIGNVSTSIIMYADDIALLAPTRGAMQKMLTICQDFGESFNLSFNTEKSESIVFGKLCYDFNLFLNDKRIPIVNSVNYLGHSLQNEILSNFNNILASNPIISDIRLRSNVILNNFSFLSTDSKIRIFNTNCSTFYGSVLLNQTANSLKGVDVAWRKSCRKLLQLPQRTHCSFIPYIMGTLPPSQQIKTRTVNFFRKGLNHSSEFIRFIFNNCLNEASSVLYKNINQISKDTNISLSDLLKKGKPKVKIKKLFEIERDWRMEMVKELLYCRDGYLYCYLDFNEIKAILYDLCVN